MIHAIIHTVGVVLGKTYIPLELSYQDTCGCQAHFLINSPINYSKMRRYYPHSRPDAFVTMTEGVPYSEILWFLKNRHRYLENIFGICIFGYKGNSYQTKVLDDANIMNRINLECLMVPRLNHIQDDCPWHKGPSKCSQAALKDILNHLM